MERVSEGQVLMGESGVGLGRVGFTGLAAGRAAVDAVDRDLEGVVHGVARDLIGDDLIDGPAGPDSILGATAGEDAAGADAVAASGTPASVRYVEADVSDGAQCKAAVDAAVGDGGGTTGGSAVIAS